MPTVLDELKAEVEARKRQIRALDAELAIRQLEQYKPYPKQIDFHNAGSQYRERLLIAGNQLGKTLSASREVAMHATGRYPIFRADYENFPGGWKGRIFDKPTSGWVASITSQGTRDAVQRLLLGKPGEFGTGAIPKRDLVEVKKSVHGVSDSVESIVVRHYPVYENPRKLSDGNSRITIKTYDQGRERWQGDTLDYVWLDEEPDEDIYTEGLTRTNATKGIVFLTFTPLKGMSNVVRRFLQEKPPGTHVTQMTIEDALHYTPAERAAIASTYKEHERDARLRGIPMLGSGRIFPFADEMIAEYPMQIPAWWPRIVGIDFGYEHPTAAVWCAWDRDTDTIHIYDAYRVKEGTPAVHSAVLRAKGAWIPVVWPHDGETRDGRGSGISLAQQYRDFGVNMHREKATLPPARGQKEGEGGNSTEAGITMMFDRMQTGRLKVARHLNDWWEEMRLYHRKDGLIVKEMDDLMSATRNAVTMIRHAKVKDAPRSNNVRDFVPTVSGMAMG